MASYGGAVTSGSLCALLQSAGATGLGGGPIGLLAFGGFVIIGGVCAGAYALTKHIKEKMKEKEVTGQSQCIHVCKTCQTYGTGFLGESCLTSRL